MTRRDKALSCRNNWEARVERPRAADRENRNGRWDRSDRDLRRAAPAAPPRTRADSPLSFRVQKFPVRERRQSARYSRPEREYRAALATTDILARVTF